MDESLQSKIDSSTRLQTVKYVNVASMALLIFDYFLTLEAEIDYIWLSKWGIGKLLYIFARYPAFVDTGLQIYYSLAPNVPLHFCKPVYIGSSVGTIFGVGVAEVILILRTYALWGARRGILLYLSIQFAVIYIAALVILGIFLKSLNYGQPPLPVVTGCYPTEGSVILFADFVLLIVNESIILFLTLFIGFKSYRHSPNQLVVILYRDGILYFVYLFCASAGNIIVLLAGPPEFVDLLDTFQRVMHCLLAARIMLHVRESDPTRRNLTSLRIGARSGLHFKAGTDYTSATDTTGLETTRADDLNQAYFGTMSFSQDGTPRREGTRSDEDARKSYPLQELNKRDQSHVVA